MLYYNPPKTTNQAIACLAHMAKDVERLRMANLHDNMEFGNVNHPAYLKLRQVEQLLAEAERDLDASREHGAKLHG